MIAGKLSAAKARGKADRPGIRQIVRGPRLSRNLGQSGNMQDDLHAAPIPAEASDWRRRFGQSHRKSRSMHRTCTYGVLSRVNI
jgi:hypothetical protein